MEKGGKKKEKNGKKARKKQSERGKKERTRPYTQQPWLGKSSDEKIGRQGPHCTALITYQCRLCGTGNAKAQKQKWGLTYLK